MIIKYEFISYLFNKYEMNHVCLFQLKHIPTHTSRYEMTHLCLLNMKLLRIVSTNLPLALSFT